MRVQRGSYANGNVTWGLILGQMLWIHLAQDEGQ